MLYHNTKKQTNFGAYTPKAPLGRKLATKLTEGERETTILS